MNENLKEILLGVLYGIITMLFMIGMLPWSLVSSLIGCGIAMLAVWRIRKRMRAGDSVRCFTVSYMAVVIVAMLLLNSLSIGA